MLEQDGNYSLDVNVWAEILVFVLLSVCSVILKCFLYLYSSSCYYDISKYI